jgi:hypothetical protein
MTMPSVATILALSLAFFNLGQHARYLLLEKLLQLFLGIFVKLVLFTEALSQILSSVSFVNHDALLVTGTQIDINKEQRCVVVLFLFFTFTFVFLFAILLTKLFLSLIVTVSFAWRISFLLLILLGRLLLLKLLFLVTHLQICLIDIGLINRLLVLDLRLNFDHLFLGVCFVFLLLLCSHHCHVIDLCQIHCFLVFFVLL